MTDDTLWTTDPTTGQVLPPDVQPMAPNSYVSPPPANNNPARYGPGYEAIYAPDFKPQPQPEDKPIEVVQPPPGYVPPKVPGMSQDAPPAEQKPSLPLPPPAPPEQPPAAQKPLPLPPPAPPEQAPANADPYAKVAGAINHVENPTANPAAQNPYSSAAGNGQFVNQTWIAQVQKYHPDVAQGLNPQQILELRNDPSFAAQITADYARENATTLASHNFEVNAANLYLAHVMGATGAMKSLTAPPETPIDQVVGPLAMTMNPQWRGMSNGQVQTTLANRITQAMNQPAPNESDRFDQLTASSHTDDDLATFDQLTATPAQSTSPAAAALTQPESSYSGVGKAVGAGLLDASANVINTVANPSGSLAHPLGTAIAFAHDALAPYFGYERFPDKIRNALLSDDETTLATPGNKLITAIGNATGINPNPEQKTATETLVRKGVGGAAALAMLGPEGVAAPIAGAAGAVAGSKAAETVPDWAKPATEMATNLLVAGSILARAEAAKANPPKPIPPGTSIQPAAHDFRTPIQRSADTAERTAKFEATNDAEWERQHAAGLNPDPNAVFFPHEDDLENFSNQSPADVAGKADQIERRLNQTAAQRRVADVDRTDYLGQDQPPTTLEQAPNSDRAAKYQTVMKKDGEKLRELGQKVDEDRRALVDSIDTSQATLGQLTQARKTAADANFKRVFGENGHSVEPAEVHLKPVDDAINAMKQAGADKSPVLNRLLSSVQDNLRDANGEFETDPRRVYRIGEAIDQALDRSIPENQAGAKFARKELTSIKDMLDDALNDATLRTRDRRIENHELAGQREISDSFNAINTPSSATSIDAMSGKPDAVRAWRSKVMLNKISNNLFGESGPVDATHLDHLLDSIKDSIDNHAAELVPQPDGTTASRPVSDIRGSDIDDLIALHQRAEEILADHIGFAQEELAKPVQSYADARQAFARNSQKINEITALRDAGFDRVQDVNKPLRAADVNNVISKLVDNLREDGTTSDANSVSNETWNKLFNLRDDLARSEAVFRPGTRDVRPGVATTKDIEKYTNALTKPSLLANGLKIGAVTAANTALDVAGTAIGAAFGHPIIGTAVTTPISMLAEYAAIRAITGAREAAIEGRLKGYQNDLTSGWNPSETKPGPRRNLKDLLNSKNPLILGNKAGGPNPFDQLFLKLRDTEPPADPRQSELMFPLPRDRPPVQPAPAQPAPAASAPRTSVFDNLSPRQRQIAEGMAALKSDKQIGRDLDISPATVKIHKAAVFERTGLNSRFKVANAINNERTGTGTAPAPLPQGLTPQQSKIAALLRDGLSIKEIANQLGSSVGTVKTHMAAASQKLGSPLRAIVSGTNSLLKDTKGGGPNPLDNKLITDRLNGGTSNPVPLRAATETPTATFKDAGVPTTSFGPNRPGTLAAATPVAGSTEFDNRLYRRSSNPVPLKGPENFYTGNTYKIPEPVPAAVLKDVMFARAYQSADDYARDHNSFLPLRRLDPQRVRDIAGHESERLREQWNDFKQKGWLR